MAQKIKLAVFGDTGATRYQEIYRQAGEALARAGAQVVCVGDQNDYPRAFVQAILGAGGKVSMIAVEGGTLPDVPLGVEIRFVATREDAALQAMQTTDAIFALPAGIATTAALYHAWVAAGGAKSGKPVGLLNRDRAFEIVRGFVSDVANVGLGNTEKQIQISDNIEDLLNRLMRVAVIVQ